MMTDNNYIKRMKNELEELVSKMRELCDEAPESNGRPEKKHALIGLQLVQMGAYAEVLVSRIKLAKEDLEGKGTNAKFEKRGTYRGYEYYVYRAPEMMGGYLLGYVKTDLFEDLDSIECNGGISFQGKFREDDERHSIGNCIGWDYGHSWDYHPIYNENGTISSVLTVEMEARSVIDQILNK